MCLLLLSLAVPFAAEATTSTVVVDFARPHGPPLTKDKFGVYNCPYFSMTRWFRDIHLLEELGCRHLRYDPTWGGHNIGIDMNSPQISGSPDKLTYNFTDFDRFTDSLLQRNIQPMYALGYTPQPLQRTLGVWADPPSDLAAWRTICRDYAAHWRTTGRCVTHYEIWNEPDNPPFFFRGTKTDYFEIYRHGALGVKEGDPQALVGGPTVAALHHDHSWIIAFLDYVTSESLPLDFLSFHNYGNPIPIIEKARTALAKHPKLAHIPLMLTEYNSYVPQTPDFVKGGDIESYKAASRLLHDFKALLEYPDVTRVYWAMFNDPDTPERCGLVSLDGHRKAAFNAFRIYNEMPEPGVHAITSSPDMEALASTDTTASAVIIWNNSDRDHHTTATLTGLESGAKLKCFRIDRSHSSYYDNPRSETLEAVTEQDVPSLTTTWSGTIPAGSVVYLRQNLTARPAP